MIVGLGSALFLTPRLLSLLGRWLGRLLRDQRDQKAGVQAPQARDRLGRVLLRASRGVRLGGRLDRLDLLQRGGVGQLRSDRSARGGASVTGSVTTRRSLVYLPTLLDPALDAAHPREHRGHRLGAGTLFRSFVPLPPCAGSSVFLIKRSFRSAIETEKNGEALRVEIAHKMGERKFKKSPRPGEQNRPATRGPSTNGYTYTK